MTIWIPVLRDQLWYSNGRFAPGCQMVWYSHGGLKNGLKKACLWSKMSGMQMVRKVTCQPFEYRTLVFRCPIFRWLLWLLHWNEESVSFFVSCYSFFLCQICKTLGIWIPDILKPGILGSGSKCQIQISIQNGPYWMPFENQIFLVQFSNAMVFHSKIGLIHQVL